MISDSPVIKWGARLLLLAIVIGLIWCFVRQNDKYEYKGIKKYKEKDQSESLMSNFINFFRKQKRKPKKKKRINKTEEKCRKIIQKIYNKPFPSVRPDFLRSPMTNKNLELDCYNKELNIALEYNGKQHYTYTPYFHKSKKNFYSQVHRDDWKRKRCREIGIKLVEIPYWVVEMDLENYIKRELRKKGCL